ncbi:MAG: trigger factor [Gammaproteobacteria bacterium CG22_combo_CG10-13_8_21_14_all_40_8]|nr:MAG: trigger factor [Gammaproteobacteria bacterium CG22_combo_CG10-13_8_21_14_all_40_8]
MQVSVETTKGLERRMTVGLPAETVNNEITKRLKKLATTQRIPGFRPGKIPLTVIKKRYEQPVRHEVLTEVMQRGFYQAIMQEKLTPAGAPRVEPKDQEGELFEFEALFEVYPEITVSELSSLELNKVHAEVTEADVDNMIETLRKQRASWESVRRMAKKGDMVVIDFEGSIDGENFDGGTAENVSVVLGEGKMLADFETGLLKLKADEEKEIEMTFPDDYQATELAGKVAKFKIKAHEVKGQKLPDVDDEFLKLFGIEEGGVDELKAEVRTNMQRELSQTIKNKLKAEVLDKLAKDNQIDLPKALVDQEIDRQRLQMLQQMKGRNVSELPELPASLFEEQASKRVTLGLVVSEIIKTNELKVDAEKVRSTIDEMAAAYDEPEQVVNWYYADKNRLAEVESLVLEDEVVAFILAKAKVTHSDVSFDEIMKPKA